jgi:hypothetical protein
MEGLSTRAHYGVSAADAMKSTAVFMIAIAILIGGIYSFFNFDAIVKALNGNVVFKICTTVALLFVGWLLNWMKVHYRLQYSSLELFVGAIGIYLSFGADDIAKGVGALFGGLYVVVRGIDNLKEWKKKYNEGKKSAVKAT